MVTNASFILFFHSHTPFLADFFVVFKGYLSLSHSPGMMYIISFLRIFILCFEISFYFPPSLSLSRPFSYSRAWPELSQLILLTIWWYLGKLKTIFWSHSLSLDIYFHLFFSQPFIQTLYISPPAFSLSPSLSRSLSLSLFLKKHSLQLYHLFRFLIVIVISWIFACWMFHEVFGTYSM